MINRRAKTILNTIYRLKIDYGTPITITQEGNEEVNWSELKKSECPPQNQTISRAIVLPEKVARGLTAIISQLREVVEKAEKRVIVEGGDLVFIPEVDTVFTIDEKRFTLKSTIDIGEGLAYIFILVGVEGVT